MFIRYTCHVVWILVVGVIGLGVTSMWKVVPKQIDVPLHSGLHPAEFAGKTPSGSVVTSSQFGRAEMLQYGELNSRNYDLAVVLVMPP